MTDFKLDSILSKVRGLIQKAESLDQIDTVEAAAESDACRKMADTLMLKYAIDQATLRDSQPEALRMKPAKISIPVCPVGSPYEAYILQLVSVVCEHTRTSAVVSNAGVPADLISHYIEWGKRDVIAGIYGFESDLRYFEILFTTLHLHMSAGIDPKIDWSLSDEENAYQLHNSGLNWGEIAKLYYGKHKMGWHGHSPDPNYPGGYWRKAYKRQVKKLGTAEVSLPANFSDKARQEWRTNFAASYTSKLRKRFWMLSNERDTGADLVLKSSMDAIRKAIEEDNPNGLKEGTAPEVPKYNEAAWKAGASYADSADLNASTRVGNNTGRKAL